MDIKLLGIEFELGKGIAFADYFKHIAATKGHPIVLFKYGRFLYVAEIGDFYAGLLITTKDQKKFLEFTHDAGDAKLEAKDVTEGAQLADFNFFIINKTSGRGLYQYYHNSCSINTFGMLCKRHYESLKADRIHLSIASLGPTKPTAKQEKEIRSAYSGTLKWNILVRPEAFSALVAQLSSIKALTVSVTTLAYRNTIFSPLAKRAKRMTQRFRFPSNAAPAGVLEDIETLVAIPELESARVEGKDENGLDQVIKLQNTPDSFGIFDYDRVAEMMNFSPRDFAASPFLKELMKVAEEKKSLF